MSDRLLNVSVRFVTVVFNECVIFWITVSTDLGDGGGLGLIINFASAKLICELDDILFESSRVQNLKENFTELEKLSNDPDYASKVELENN